LSPKLTDTVEGRLNEATLNLLSGSDIQFHRHNRLDIALVKNHKIALVFLPAADIPTFVGEGRVDLGITGRDQVAEHEVLNPPTEDSGVDELLDLEFGKCKLQVQVPEKGNISKPEELIGRNVVTSFTNLATSYFQKLEGQATNGMANGDSKPAQLNTHIKYVGGSVEAACALGVADGIVDLVGKTCVSVMFSRKLTPRRIGRDNASGRPKIDLYSCREHGHPHQEQAEIHARE